MCVCTYMCVHIYINSLILTPPVDVCVRICACVYILTPHISPLDVCVYILTPLYLPPPVDVDQAVTIFKELEAVDPFRLDNLDTYSNLLYVKEMRVELSHLAHRIVQVDKYRVETCCVIGEGEREGEEGRERLKGCYW